MVREKVKIQWVVDKSKRMAALRKRRKTLLKMAREISILCDIAVAVVVYSPGKADPAIFPPSEEDARGVLETYRKLPNLSKANLKIEDFLRERIEKSIRELEKLRVRNRESEVCLALNDMSLGRRSSYSGISPDLVDAIKASYLAHEQEVLRCIEYRMKSSQAQEEEEALVVPPPPFELAPALVADAPADLMAPLVAVPPVPVEAPEIEVPQLAVAVAPPVAVVANDAPPSPLLPGELDAEPLNGSYVLAVVQAIMDDGSGNNFVPTPADVQRVMMEHGLFNPRS